MIRLACFCLLLLSPLVRPAALSAQQPRPKDFGRRWIRSPPFTLMALVQRNEAVASDDRYSKAGLSVMLAWDHWKHRAGVFEAAKRQNLPWIYHLEKRYRTLADIKKEVNGVVKKYPGGLGFLA